MLYKYRSTTNFQLFMDIIINERMYAAKFTELNDPMEGLYKYSAFSCNERIIKDISSEKNQVRVLSLSRSFKNPLMWSHYAEGHQGIVIGVEIPDNIEKISINYEKSSFMLNNTDEVNSREIAKKVLSTKYDAWKYEEEERIFTTDGSKYVPVTIKEIILGKRINPDVSDLIIKTANKINHNIIVRKMSEIELEKGFLFTY